MGKQKLEGQLGREWSGIQRSRNALVIPLVASEYSHRGVCDKYLIHSFWRGFIELKNVGEHLSDHQAEFITMAVERGECVAIVTFTNRVAVYRDTKIEVIHYCLRNVDHFGMIERNTQHIPPVMRIFTCTAFDLIDQLYQSVQLARI